MGNTSSESSRRGDDIQIVLTDWQHDAARIRPVRETVFIVEQAVPPHEEWDEYDADAIHALAVLPNRDAVGTARLRPDGNIGRMAVLAAYRGAGLGARMLTALLHEADRLGIRDLWLHAQTHAIGFYRRFGFSETGDVFDEAGIAHQKMTRRSTAHDDT
jgi:predicted GNAT family N-acyltransferase